MPTSFRRSVAVAPIKPVLRKHGKLISLFRSFILSRPSRRSLKQQGILRERVFGCDLGEHLLNCGHDGEFSTATSPVLVVYRYITRVLVGYRYLSAFGSIPLPHPHFGGMWEEEQGAHNFEF